MDVRKLIGHYLMTPTVVKFDTPDFIVDLYDKCINNRIDMTDNRFVLTDKEYERLSTYILIENIKKTNSDKKTVEIFNYIQDDKKPQLDKYYHGFVEVQYVHEALMDLFECSLNPKPKILRNRYDTYQNMKKILEDNIK